MILDEVLVFRVLSGRVTRHPDHSGKAIIGVRSSRAATDGKEAIGQARPPAGAEDSLAAA
jgi:hypothetical protein